MKTDLRGQGAWRHIVRAAKRRKKVVQRIIVGQVNGGQLQAHFVLIAVQDVVVPERQVEQIAVRNARRIVVIVLGIRRGHLDERGSE